MLWVNYAYIDHVVMGVYATFLLLLFDKHDTYIKAKSSQTSVCYLSIMNPGYACWVQYMLTLAIW